MGFNLMGKDWTDQEGQEFDVTTWAWAPILALVRSADEMYDLGLDTSGWGYNDGDLLDKEGCLRLADALAKMLEADSSKKFHIEHSDSGVLEALLGKLQDEGFSTIPELQVFSTPRQDVEEFVRFLKACGGFEIL